MDAIRNSACIGVVLALCVAHGHGEPGPAQRSPSTSLFTQSAVQKLTRDFDSSNISFLLLDAQTGAVLGSRWDDPRKPIPVGSLVKPIVALAYGEQHAFVYPTHVCRGTATGCWLPHGHGDVDISSAIAHSCNSYFRVLTGGMTAAEVSPIARRLGLEIPSGDASGPELTGLGNRWSIAPLNIARAYLELLRRRDQPGVRQIFDGMEASAEQGTGADVDRALPYPDALVKTGTAACTHAARAPGDGFTIALLPAENPSILLLIRVHGVSGAKAANVAGAMLQRIEE